MRFAVRDGKLKIDANRDELLRMAMELIDLAKTAKQPHGRTPTTFVNDGVSNASTEIEDIEFRRA